jgi:MFS family permease
VVLTLLVDQRSASALGVGSKGAMSMALAFTLAGFVLQERRALAPVVNLALFRIRMFAFSALSLLALAIVTSVLTFLLPFYIQDVLHLSASFMGLLFLSAPILTIGLAPVSGHLTDRIGPRIPASIGLVATMIAFVLGTMLRVESHWMLATVLLICTGIGQGFFNTANQTAIIASVPREYRGFAAGMVQTVFGISSLLGITLGGALLTVMFQHYSGIPGARPDADHPHAFVASMNAIYLVCLALVALALAFSLLRGRTRIEAPTS